MQAIKLYNLYISNVTSHNIQFHNIDHHLRRAESTAMATITSTPHHSIAKEIYIHLRRIGLPVQLCSIDCISKAAKCRVYLSNFAYRNYVEQLQADTEHPDALVYYDKTYWANNTILANVSNAFKIVNPVPILQKHCHLERVRVKQVLANKLLETSWEDDVKGAITRRLRKWLSHEGADEACSRFVKIMNAQAKIVPRFVLAAFLKTVTNAWSTKGRYGAKTPCMFGCGLEGGSRVEHVMECQILHECAGLYCKNWQGWPTSGTFIDSMAINTPPESTRASIMLIWHDIAHQIYFGMKHSGGTPMAHTKTRIRAISRHHPRARALLLQCYRGEG